MKSSGKDSRMASRKASSLMCLRVASTSRLQGELDVNPTKCAPSRSASLIAPVRLYHKGQPALGLMLAFLQWKLDLHRQVCIIMLDTGTSDVRDELPVILDKAACDWTCMQLDMQPDLDCAMHCCRQSSMRRVGSVRKCHQRRPRSYPPRQECIFENGINIQSCLPA